MDEETAETDVEIAGRKEGGKKRRGKLGKTKPNPSGENTNRTRKPCCRGTREKGKEPEMETILEIGCGEQKWRKPDARKGRETRGKHTGNESRETCGGPVPIED